MPFLDGFIAQKGWREQVHYQCKYTTTMALIIIINMIA